MASFDVKSGKIKMNLSSRLVSWPHSKLFQTFVLHASPTIGKYVILCEMAFCTDKKLWIAIVKRGGLTSDQQVQTVTSDMKILTRTAIANDTTQRVD